MDYKEQIAYLRYLEQQSQHIEASAFARAARSIADLLARAETAEARVNELETLHRTEMCEDGWDCVALGKEREKVKRLEMKIERLKRIMRNSGILVISADGPGSVFVKRKCEQKGPKKVSTFSTRFHVVSNAFPKYQMLTF